MKVIILTGLVSVEKTHLSLELAEKAIDNGLSVKILDNIARQSIQTDIKSIPVIPVDGDILLQLAEILPLQTVDLLVVAVSEQTHPEKLFVAVDTLREQFADYDIYTLAMIDTRTCDCFPNVREALELYADATIMLPYKLDSVLDYVALT